MKFTEEQYQQIIKSWGSENNLINSTERVTKLVEYFVYGDLYGNADEAIALGNEVTREWAYEQFVEKEKKYVWRLKTDKNLVISTLFDGWFVDGAPAGKMRFSEKEIAKSPFKPEWFDKEEVE